ncbi:DUF4926 domain-containing protein [Sphaerotilus mobilis]|uniref:Uncharacterized protein DUF4926 n=1 Tax=Sphaerotilus mobilis TaxID=47994 RepID=A0A4Q7LG53_9BURK|nr:DUF4926 domain-containing protein [Sphaerotilus mobilis]RZS53011.1 uncharacterized protein DUF4926 [Sphaerotilus mobilis]
MTIQLHDHVVARVDVPEVGVRAGAAGVVIEVYPDGSFDVEFAPDVDENLVIASMTSGELAPVQEAPRLAA